MLKKLKALWENIPNPPKKAFPEATSIVFALLPVAVLGKLVGTIANAPELDTQLRQYLVYAEILSYMENMNTKFIIATVVVLFFGFMLLLAYLGTKDPGKQERLHDSTVISRFILRFSVAPLASLIAFVGGYYSKTTYQSFSFIAIQFAIALAIYWSVAACERESAA